MRSLRWSFIVFLLVFRFAFVHAQVKTDVQLDGLAGPVKSVSSSTVQARDVQWQQPEGPTMVAPIWCRHCEYDPDGNKTKSGQMMDSKFYGERIRLVRDDEGKVTDRYSYDVSTGELRRHDLLGAYGKTEQNIYTAGKLRYRTTYAYDQYGNTTETRSFDRAGGSQGYTLAAFTQNGTLLKGSTYTKDNKLSYEQTYDPDTGIEDFTAYDEFGKVNLTWTVAKGKVISFWEPGDSLPKNFGEHFTEPEGAGNVDDYACHSDLHCDLSHVHYEYLDGDMHTPLSAEWRDAEGNLKLATYFEYDLDAYHNWTTRKVWVWNPDLGVRTLSQTDARIITYWK
jgi:hypothetical protein